jgi:hypothetical protein
VDLGFGDQAGVRDAEGYVFEDRALVQDWFLLDEGEVRSVGLERDVGDCGFVEGYAA